MEQSYEKMWEEKLARAKEILETIITGANGDSNGSVRWLPEWIVCIRKWSSEIKVEAARGLMVIVLHFPLPAEARGIFQMPIQPEVRTSSATTASKTYLIYGLGRNGSDIESNLDDRALIWYRQQAKLDTVPPNILVWTILFFVNQLGGSIRHTFPVQSALSRCENWLFLREQHRFENFDLISDVMDTTKCLASVKQGWVRVQMGEYASTLELPISHYLSILLDTFKDYLIMRTIENCFSWRANNLIDDARNFENSLTEEPGREVFINYNEQGTQPNEQNEQNVQFVRVFILPQLAKGIKGITLQDKLAFKIGPRTSSALGAFTPSNESNTSEGSNADLWALAFWEEGISQLVGKLDGSDIDCILRIFVEINHHIGELEKSITTQLANTSKDGIVEYKFPGANDHFQSFDPPFLRGTLSQTIPYVRLIAYKQNVAALREQAANSTSPVPTAVVNLIGSYLPPF